MKSRKWDAKELLLFYTGESNQEIADMTGRTLNSVRKKRFRLRQGHSDKPSDIVCFNPYKELTQADKIRRIKDMAVRFQVKLKEE